MEKIIITAKKPTAFQRQKQWFITHKPKNKVLLIVIGLLATIWFIIRVVPKPSRIHYPCMQLAAPFASSFTLYLIGLFSGIFAFKGLRTSIQNAKLAWAFFFVVLLIASFSTYLINGSPQIFSAVKGQEPDPNQPVGVAKGIFPGRVVWVWSSMATNENCTNLPGDYWWQDQNNNQEEINRMLVNSLLKLAGTQDESTAWDSLFTYYNRTHGRGNRGYLPGEKIAIKVNITTGGWGNVNEDTYEKFKLLDYMDGSPHLMLSFLQQLVEKAGVAPENISMGDPIRLFHNQYWDKCHTVYPDVKYLDWLGKLGRTKAVASAQPVLFYSDGEEPDSLPQAYLDAAYMINIGCLKQHDCAGGTFCAKNHFGSICRNMAVHLHYSLPSPNPDLFQNLGYGKFRNLVDLMEHKDLGQKTMLFVVDGLWGGELPVSVPKKWQMTPFNNDWPNSLFVSQDHVAIESVGFDFVRAEFDLYSHMLGADDYLLQAADSANWSEGITYDPDADGELIASMGVYERWNNEFDKQYTRNLGTGNGIELYKDFWTGIPDVDSKLKSSLRCVPNPAKEHVRIQLSGSGIQKGDQIKLYNQQMQRIACYTIDQACNEFAVDVKDVSPGVYIVSLETARSTKQIMSKLVVLAK